MDDLFQFKAMGVLLVTTWVSLAILGIYLVWKILKRPRRFSRSTMYLLGFILFVPLVFLYGKYGTVTCATLKPEFACACYAIGGRASRDTVKRKENFSKANRLCPGYPSYKSRSF